MLGTDGGKLRGRLRRPAGNVNIVLTPADSERFYLVNRTVQADEDGTFEIAGIAPGSYVVYAMADGAAANPLDPETRARLASYGFSLRIRPNETTAVELEALPHRD